ncbi:MAG: cytochrome ubiquinol oxidase subunit I [Desulfuromonadales bacterium]|nr:cytochrome ubiquinol oxidase subunit I [Desulfuromonadales bacterium]
MGVLGLSRLQFAATGAFHFIFVPLTLGLSIMVAWMQTRYYRTGDETYLRMTKFWGKLFLINFALGVVTGITMEFQFGMNWAEYSKYVGDIFGAPLAIEATVAFFLESVFIGVWIFGWNKISKGLHLMSIWIVALATNLSALWILIANGWMQKPVGFVLRNGRAEMVDFMALVTNPYALLKFGHQIVSGYTVAAFFVLGISAWHLLRKNETELFKKSFKMAAIFGFVSTILVAVIGDFHTVEVVRSQPTKFAAMESVWNTERGAGMHLLLIPDPAHERDAVEAVTIPKMLSILSHHDPNAEVKGLKDFPLSDRPPVLPVFLGFRGMVGLGFLFILTSFFALLLSFKDRIESAPMFLKILVFMIPLPYIANQLGWIVAEVGRQPWIVYGVLRTSDAVSKSLTMSQVTVSFVGFVLLYGLLGVIDIYLLIKYARKGPDIDVSGFLNRSEQGE